MNNISIEPVDLENDLPIDILDRQKFVEHLLELLETLVSSDTSCTLALNGKWGSGKSFVLAMLERQLRVYQDGGKYIVFHYNCWQYDYYEEPLIAIIAAMVDDIDSQIDFFSQANKEKLSQGLAAVRPILKKIAVSFVENKIGVDLSPVSDMYGEMKNQYSEASQKAEDEHKYDTYYAFKQVLDKVKGQLRELAETHTLVIVVDELDRCLPDYAIKILERLHHLFADVNGTILILGIDRPQLDRTIKQIFGENVDTATYLKKFINLEIYLDEGNVNANFSEKYRAFLSMFNETLLASSFSINDYISALFSGMAVRTQERLIEKVTAIHRLLFKDEKKDYSFMCFELLMATWTQIPLSSEKLVSQLKEIPIQANFQRRSGRISCSTRLPSAFAEHINNNCQCQNISVVHVQPEDRIAFHHPIDIFELLVLYSQKVYGEEPDKYVLDDDIPRKQEISKYKIGRASCRERVSA